MTTNVQPSAHPKWEAFKSSFKQSNYITDFWNWFMTLMSKAAEMVLFGTVLYSGYQLLPGVPHVPASVDAALVGIQVEIQEESYTSQASFLDLDPIPTYKPDDDTQYTFSGKRIGRRNRLYRAKDGRIICADVNGSYNILRKRRPDAFSKAKGVAGYVVHPVRLAVSTGQIKQKASGR